MPTIKFNYFTEYGYEVCEHPEPAQNFIPEWHKNMPSYGPTPIEPSGQSLSIYEHGSNASAKKCMPMLDGISGGYIVPLWSDVHIKQTPNGPYVTWMTDMDVFSLHSSPNIGMPAPRGFHPMVMKYITYFRIETPSGYSTMIRPPAGHHDSPIQVIPATVDTDKSVIDSNFPCWIATDFEGVVKKGAPIAQLIPFKRENWKSSVEQIDSNKFMYQMNKGFLSTIKNNYVDNYWSRKKYE
jgi:hypothetical protein